MTLRQLLRVRAHRHDVQKSIWICNFVVELLGTLHVLHMRTTSSAGEARPNKVEISSRHKQYTCYRWVHIFLPQGKMELQVRETLRTRTIFPVKCCLGDDQTVTGVDFFLFFFFHLGYAQFHTKSFLSWRSACTGTSRQNNGGFFARICETRTVSTVSSW